MKKKIGAQKMDIEQVCCDPVEKKMWALVADNDFSEVIVLLSGQGVLQNDMGEKLFAFARQAIDETRFEAARSILLFLVDSLENKSEALPLISLIGDLHVKEGNYEKAREYYGQLPLTFDNIKKTFSTFIPLKDIEGLLAVRDNVRNRLTESAHHDELNNLVHVAFVEIASDPGLKNSASEKYLINQQYLKKIDPDLRKKISKCAVFSGAENRDPESLKCLRVSDKVFVRNGKAWEMVRLRSPGKRLTRQGLKQAINIAVRCATLSELIELRDVLATCKANFYKCQCYLIVDLDLWQSFMTVEDLFALTDCDFIIKIMDEKNLEDHFEEVLIQDKNSFPSFLVCSTEKGLSYAKKFIDPIINKCWQRIEIEMKGYKKELAELYPVDFPISIQEKIKNKKLRILFQTSRYTTFTQYSIRDMADGFKRLGFEVFVQIEKKGRSVGIGRDIALKNIVDFHPDLIFNINHLRFEYPWIPTVIPYVTWVQDEMPLLFSQEGAGSITELDFIYSLHPNWNKLLVDNGYRKESIGDLALSVNDNVFHPMTLTEKDIVEYDCDISYVANCSTTAFHELQKNIEANPPAYHDLIKRVYNAVCDTFSNGNVLYGFDDYMNIVENQSKLNNTILTDEKKMRIATTFWHVIGARLFRQQPLEWLSEAGYDIAIYGNGWNHHPTLAKHARGWIDNGIDLCKVFNASRINLSIHQMGNYSSRVFDGFASGGFFLMRYHSEDFKDYGLCGFFEFDYDNITFSSKDDLLRKVDLYLSSPKLKDTIVYPVRQQILKKYTYDKKIRNILGNVSDRLSNLMIED